MARLVRYTVSHVRFVASDAVLFLEGKLKGVVLRDAVVADIAAILEVQYDAVRSYDPRFADLDDARERMLKWLSGFRQKWRRIRVMLVEDRIVGVSDVEYLGPPLETYAYLVGVYVDPTVHGRGFGRALCEDQLTWLRERGASEIRCHVDPINVHAQWLLVQHGFSRDDRPAASEAEFVLSGGGAFLRYVLTL
ncbi:MAG: GNAT family N-acetyltransferase [Candidatus Doudnabacteria bacterium]|nr:GNAT family N-acetyltransferase [Candidatus Doudnabacteria bacterium]